MDGDKISTETGNVWSSLQDNECSSPSDEWSTGASVLEPLLPSVFLGPTTTQKRNEDESPNSSSSHYSFPSAFLSIDAVLEAIKQHGVGCCSGDYIEENIESLPLIATQKMKRCVDNMCWTNDTQPTNRSIEAETTSLHEEHIELQSVTMAMHLDLVHVASILEDGEWVENEDASHDSYSWINQGSTAGYFYQNE